MVQYWSNIGKIQQIFLQHMMKRTAGLCMGSVAPQVAAKPQTTEAAAVIWIVWYQAIR